MDRAYAVLTALEGGDRWISEVILHPSVTLKTGYQLTAESWRTYTSMPKSIATSSVR